MRCVAEFSRAAPSPPAASPREVVSAVGTVLAGVLIAWQCVAQWFEYGQGWALLPLLCLDGLYVYLRFTIRRRHWRRFFMGLTLMAMGMVHFQAWGSGWENPSSDFLLLFGLIYLLGSPRALGLLLRPIMLATGVIEPDAGTDIPRLPIDPPPSP
jgi:uncharacterized membrane protein